MEKAEIMQKLNGAEWLHSFELLPGITTPGRIPCGAKYLFDSRYRLPVSLSGLKAIDIGTWDGAYAFELERRGADVVAVDIQDPAYTGFNVAKELLQSKATYVRASVYDLSKVLETKFDIVCFLGLYYHLKAPVLAFEEVGRILKNDGRLLIEGECLRNWAPVPAEAATMQKAVVSKIQQDLESPATHASALQRLRSRLAGWRAARFAAKMANSDIPLTLFYAGAYKQDSSNWFIPNLACIREWLADAGLELVSHGFDDKAAPGQRFWGSARKVPHLDIPIEHGIFKAGDRW